jgi:hypothetical protein
MVRPRQRSATGASRRRRSICLRLNRLAPVRCTVLLASQSAPDLLRASGHSSSVNDCVTVGTHWDEVRSWISLAPLRLTAQRSDMVNMDEPFPDVSIDRPEVASAYQTSVPMNRQAGRAQYRVPLVDGQKSQNLGAFQPRLESGTPRAFRSTRRIPAQGDKRLPHLWPEFPMELTVQLGPPARSNDMIPATIPTRWMPRAYR